ncbi:MAG: hypothetical protein GY862_13960, partial [Gammaproteobacteria bacterium]|nr:hypothetical protein [Gammaproteobacteria bacterium]
HDSWAGVNKTDGSPGAKGSVNFIRTTLREETVEFLDGLKRGGKVPFKHLQSARNDISNALTAAQKANDGEAVKRLKGLKRDLNNETERLAKQSGGDGKVMEVAQKTADAVDFYQHTYAPLLREGNGKKFNAAVRSHANNGTEVQSFFKPDKAGQSAADEAKRLKKLTGHADDPVAAARDVRNLIMADMATTTNNLNKGAIDNYISTHSALLKEFPEAKGVLERLSRNVNATADELVQAKKAFKDASDAMKLTEGQINKSRAAQFLEADDVVSVAKKALNSSSPEKEITELLRMAARDETGQAKKGIEQAVSDALYGMVTNANRSVAQNAENFRTSLAKTEALLRKDSVRKALTRVYGEKGMKALDDVRDVLTKTARKTSTAGSDTAANVAQSQTISSENLRIMMAAYFGITKGRGIFTISKYASNLIRGDVDAKLARILVDVSTNPKKAAAFLRMREPVKVNGKFRQALEMNSEIDKSKKSLKTFLANNFPEILASDSDDKE